MKIEKPLVIELYEFWNRVKLRFNIVSPQPKSFILRKEVIPIISLDGYSIEYIDLSDDTQVNSGGAASLKELKPPDGFIYEVIDIRCLIPDPDGGGASTSGTHNLDFRFQDNVSKLARVVGNFGTDIKIDYEGFQGDTESPGASATQFQLIHQWLCASNSEPLQINYINNTDKHQTATRILQFWVKKRPEGAC